MMPTGPRTHRPSIGFARFDAAVGHGAFTFLSLRNPGRAQARANESFRFLFVSASSFRSQPSKSNGHPPSWQSFVSIRKVLAQLHVRASAFSNQRRCRSGPITSRVEDYCTGRGPAVRRSPHRRGTNPNGRAAPRSRLELTVLHVCGQGDAQGESQRRREE